MSKPILSPLLNKQLYYEDKNKAYERGAIKKFGKEGYELRINKIKEWDAIEKKWQLEHPAKLKFKIDKSKGDHIPNNLA